LTVLTGLAGIGASARLYLVPGRPAWNAPFTFVEFYLTAALLGALAAGLLGGVTPAVQSIFTLAGMVVVAAGAGKLFWLYCSPVHELRGSGVLLLTVLSPPLLARYVLLAAGLMSLPFVHGAPALVALTALVAAGEFLSRYLFFVSVVPTNMAAQYLAPEAA
jgi:DMSO reductase anchor subunit